MGKIDNRRSVHKLGYSLLTAAVLGGTWYGVFAPARTPQAIVTRLNSEIVKGLSAPEINQRFVANGGDPEPGAPDELRRYMIEESARWARTIKTAGIRVD